MPRSSAQASSCCLRGPLGGSSGPWATPNAPRTSRFGGAATGTAVPAGGALPLLLLLLLLVLVVVAVLLLLLLVVLRLLVVRLLRFGSAGILLFLLLLLLLLLLLSAGLCDSEDAPAATATGKGGAFTRAVQHWRGGVCVFTVLAGAGAGPGQCHAMQLTP